MLQYSLRLCVLIVCIKHKGMQFTERQQKMWKETKYLQVLNLIGLLGNYGAIKDVVFIKITLYVKFLNGILHIHIHETEFSKHFTKAATYYASLFYNNVHPFVIIQT